MNLGHVLIVHFTMQLKFRNCTCSVTSTPQRVELPGLRKYIWSFAGAMKYTVVCCNDIVLWSALLIVTMDIKVLLFVHSIASDQSVVDSKQALLQAVYILLLIACNDQVSVCWYHHQRNYIMWVVSLHQLLYSMFNTSKKTGIIIDGCALYWTPQCPSSVSK